MKNEIIEEEIVEFEEEKEPTTATTKGQGKELDLKEFGDMVVERGGSKPVFEKITKLKITAASLKTMPAKIEDKSGEYSQVYLNVTFDNDGTETWENYGGGRLYITEKGRKFWLSDKSALGRMIALLENTFDFEGTLKEIPKLIIGKHAGVKTEKQNVAGTEYTKNMVQAFYQ